MVVVQIGATYLEKWDLVTLTRLRRDKMAASKVDIFVHIDKRYAYLTRVTTNTASQYDLSRGAPKKIGTIPIANNPGGFWGPGTFFWSITDAGVVRQLDKNTGDVIGNFSLTTGTYNGLTGCGRFLYTQETGSNDIFRIDPVTGDQDKVMNSNNTISDLHHDGRYLWHFTGEAAAALTLRQYDLSLGTQIQIQALQLHANNATNEGLGVTMDGRFAWITLIDT